ncbi:MAG: NnrS family protein [Betaproteobacteria bacterium]|jgi:uncharacterized protein involved in response to NO
MRAPESPHHTRTNRFALFDLGFRPFYLLAALIATLSVPVWVAQWHGVLPQANYLGAMAWHAHEMVFGFAAAVITGFLFTAGRNWTGLSTPTGWHLAGLAALWVAGRIVVLTGPGPLAALVDSAFLPLVALSLWFPLKRSHNRNLFFVGLLLLFALANVLFHLSQLGMVALPPLVTARAALFLVVVIVSVMSGRVTPAFTQNAIRDARIRRVRHLDAAAIATLALTLAVQLLGAPAWLLGPLALVAAVLNAIRLAFWDPLSTLRSPIVWILHLSYAWIPVGLLLLALSTLDIGVPAILSVHAMGAGAVGGTVLGMITRTARGHSGRALQIGRAETAAYVLVHVGTLIRVFGPLAAPAHYGALLVAGATTWSSAFLIYLVVYWPMLAWSHLDSRPH